MYYLLIKYINCSRFTGSFTFYLINVFRLMFRFLFYFIIYKSCSLNVWEIVTKRFTGKSFFFFFFVRTIRCFEPFIFSAFRRFNSDAFAVRSCSLSVSLTIAFSPFLFQIYFCRLSY